MIEIHVLGLHFVIESAGLWRRLWSSRFDLQS